MALFTLANWPLLVLSVAMIVAAVIDAWKFKVPNWLTFPLVLTGWGIGLLHNLGLLADSGVGGIGASLVCTALGFALLLPIYAIGGMGAGDVKMQMGFGAWVGAFFGLGEGFWVVLYAFCAAAIIGGILALIMIGVRRQFQRNVDNTREIVADLLSAPGLGTISQKAAQRKSRLHLLPYGVPLCLGFVGYLFFFLHG
jgi:prepilin peptidase CpaA